jgi:hypothetical protein
MKAPAPCCKFEITLLEFQQLPIGFGSNLFISELIP